MWPPAIPACRRWCSCIGNRRRGAGRGAANWIFLDIVIRAIAWDMPGYGGSALLPTFSIAALADALQDFLGQVGATKPILVGHSIGGMIVQQLLGKHSPYRQLLIVIAQPVRHSANLTATAEKPSSRRGSARSIAAKRWPRLRHPW